MITRRDQELLLESLSALDRLISTNEKLIENAYKVSKPEAIQNAINNLKHFVADLR